MAWQYVAFSSEEEVHRAAAVRDAFRQLTALARARLEAGDERPRALLEARAQALEHDGLRPLGGSWAPRARLGGRGRQVVGGPRRQHERGPSHPLSASADPTAYPRKPRQRRSRRHTCAGVNSW